jgi:hypothetical protein
VNDKKIMPIFYNIFKNSVYFDNFNDAQEYLKCLLIENIDVPTIYTPQICLLDSIMYASNRVPPPTNLPYMFRQIHISFATDIINIENGITKYLIVLRCYIN